MRGVRGGRAVTAVTSPPASRLGRKAPTDWACDQKQGNAVPSVLGLLFSAPFFVRDRPLDAGKAIHKPVGFQWGKHRTAAPVSSDVSEQNGSGPRQFVPFPQPPNTVKATAPTLASSSIDACWTFGAVRVIAPLDSHAPPLQQHHDLRLQNLGASQGGARSLGAPESDRRPPSNR